MIARHMLVGLFAVIGLTAGLFSPALFAAEVVGCSLTNAEMYQLEQYGKSFLKHRTRRCLVKMHHGQIGDTVSFQSLGGYVKARGRIVAKSGPYYKVKLTELQRNIHHSDLVTLKDTASPYYWAATSLPD